MVSEWRRVSRNSRPLNLTIASSAFFFNETDARELGDRCSCNFHLTTIGKHPRPLKRAYLYLRLGVDYGRDAYLRLRN